MTRGASAISLPGVAGRRGFASIPGAVDPSLGPGEPMTRNQSPLSGLLVETCVFAAGFASVQLPGSGATPAGTCAWYGLKRYRIPDDTRGSEIGFLSAMFNLRPTDSNGIYGAGWGDTTGTTAALVVGLNLPIGEGQWSALPVPIIGIPDGTGNVAFSSSVGLGPLARTFVVEPFPPGRWSDPSPAAASTNRPFGAGMIRGTYGMTLDIALVVSGQLLAQSNAIRGYGQVQVVAALNTGVNPFRS